MNAPAPVYDGEQSFLLGVLSVCVLLLVGTPTFDLLFVLDSWSYRLSLTTEAPRLIAISFVGALVCVLPLVYFVRQRWAIQLACLGGCIGSFSCFGMAYLSRNIDVGMALLPFLNWFSFYFVLAGAVCLVFAGSLAVLLNGHMLKVLTSGADEK